MSVVFLNVYPWRFGRSSQRELLAPTRDVFSAYAYPPKLNRVARRVCIRDPRMSLRLAAAENDYLKEILKYPGTRILAVQSAGTQSA